MSTRRQINREDIPPDEITAEELDLESGQIQTTIPIAGGSTSIVISISGLEKLAEVLDVEMVDANPDVQDIYKPRGIKIDGTSVGMTVAAGTGTTLTVKATGLGTAL